MALLYILIIIGSNACANTDNSEPQSTVTAMATNHTNEISVDDDIQAVFQEHDSSKESAEKTVNMTIDHFKAHPEHQSDPDICVRFFNSVSSYLILADNHKVPAELYDEAVVNAVLNSYNHDCHRQLLILCLVDESYSVSVQEILSIWNQDRLNFANWAQTTWAIRQSYDVAFSPADSERESSWQVIEMQVQNGIDDSDFPQLAVLLYLLNPSEPDEFAVSYCELTHNARKDIALRKLDREARYLYSAMIQQSDSAPE